LANNGEEKWLQFSKSTKPSEGKVQHKKQGSNMPKVSVIIPTYNYGKYIEKAIDSVLAQTYQDFEIIVVNDGSTDNTREIIETKYKNKVRYFYQENKGAPAARNKGIKESKGEYLAFLDADDYFEPSSVEKKVSLLESNKDSGWVYSDWDYLDIQGNVLKFAFANAPFASKRKLRGYIFKDMLCGTLISTPAVLVCKTWVEEVGGFDERLNAFQDYDLWLRISYRYEVEYVDEVLAHMRLHDESISVTQPPYPARAIINRKIEQNYGDYIQDLGIEWRKIKASEYNYWGKVSLEKGDVNQAIKYYISSIKNYPFQKRVYLQIIKAYLKLAGLL
jgi:glycosyltransferase involved in cell wall biosynthesis